VFSEDTGNQTLHLLLNSRDYLFDLSHRFPDNDDHQIFNGKAGGWKPSSNAVVNVYDWVARKQ
jgi:hypothetical protein